MRKKTVVQIALGAALCMAAGGLLAFGRVQRDEGVKLREKAVAVQAELAELEAMIGETEDEAEALRQRMDGAREQYETLQDAVDRSLDQVAELYYSDDPLARNVLLCRNPREYLDESIYRVNLFDQYPYQNMEEIQENEFTASGGIRFVSENGDRSLLRLAGIYYDSYLMSQKEYRDAPFDEFSGWTVVFRESGLEETEGDACQTNGHTFCVRDGQTKTLYLLADPHCLDREMLHGLAHIYADAYWESKGYQNAAKSLYERRNEYDGALLSPALHLTDQDEFMAEILHGALTDSRSYLDFDQDNVALILWWGLEELYDEGF